MEKVLKYKRKERKRGVEPVENINQEEKGKLEKKVKWR